MEQEGVRFLSKVYSDAEAHAQIGKVEKHGHLFETILQKVLDQVQPKNKDENEHCVTQTMNAKNEMLNQKGLSPASLFLVETPEFQEIFCKSGHVR